jgi:predicted ABC-type ATPase
LDPFLIALTESWKEDCNCYGSFSESDLKTIEETASCAISIHSSFLTIPDTEFLENARNAGYNTKVIFVSTEDPDLNVGRILIRMGHGGQSVPLAAIPESYGESMKSLRKARKHADDVLVYDNTPDGKGHRLVARFIAGELVKTTRTSPEWLRSLFGRELDAENRQRERPSRGR